MWLVIVVLMFAFSAWGGYLVSTAAGALWGVVGGLLILALLIGMSLLV